MNSATIKPGRASTAFLLAAAIAILFNTALACVKESYPPLNKAMASLTGHHWTTHGLADIALFAVLGLVFWKTGAAEKIDANRLTSLLIASVVIAGGGLVAFYLLF